MSSLPLPVPVGSTAVTVATGLPPSSSITENENTNPIDEEAGMVEEEMAVVVPAIAVKTPVCPEAAPTTTLPEEVSSSVNEVQEQRSVGVSTRLEDPSLPQQAKQQTQRPERPFPDEYYDPLTNCLMKNPVVDRLGDSYDQSTVVTKPTREDSNTTNKDVDDDNGVVVYYPNRALQAIILRDLEAAAVALVKEVPPSSSSPTAAASPSSSVLVNSLRRMDSALQSGWNKLVENSAFPSTYEYKPLPNTFYCPITCELMVDPMITPWGNSYERDAIENWVTENGTAPLTRDTITIPMLRPNNALYHLIQAETLKTRETMHPSIKRWKDLLEESSSSSPPTTTTLHQQPHPVHQRRPWTPPTPQELALSRLPPPSAPPLQEPFWDIPYATAGAVTTRATSLAVAAQQRRRFAQATVSMSVLVGIILVVILLLPFGIAALIILVASFCVLLSNAWNESDDAYSTAAAGTDGGPSTTNSHRRAVWRWGRNRGEVPRSSHTSDA